MSIEQDNGRAVVAAFFKTPMRRTRAEMRAHFTAYMREQRYRDARGVVKSLRAMALDLCVTQTTIKRWLKGHPAVAAAVSLRDPRKRGQG